LARADVLLPIIGIIKVTAKLDIPLAIGGTQFDWLMDMEGACLLVI
jgi:hypothetical protein